jgi:hypothetical protein
MKYETEFEYFKETIVISKKLKQKNNLAFFIMTSKMTVKLLGYFQSNIDRD